MTERPQGKVDKGWGYEVIWTSNDRYAGKILVFTRPGAKMSMHFHKEKEETWFVNSGKFILRWIDTKEARLHERVLSEGDVWHNPALQPHQLEAMLPDSMIFEVSTADSIEDTYRIAAGDSQKVQENTR
jgi:mannose-6-phosphate isomerase-like protein (cupin superfamily)